MTTETVWSEIIKNPSIFQVYDGFHELAPDDAEWHSLLAVDSNYWISSGCYSREMAKESILPVPYSRVGVRLHLFDVWDLSQEMKDQSSPSELMNEFVDKVLNEILRPKDSRVASEKV